MKNLLIGILFLSTSAFGQAFNFDIHNTSLEEYLKVEKELGSKKIPTTYNHISSTGEAQPIKFLRKETILPDLTVFYFFKKADSTMSYIRYEWDVSNFEKKMNNQKPEKYQKAFVTKYKELKEAISEEFGQPTVKSNYSNLAEYEHKYFFNESSNWIPNDSTEVELYSITSNYYEKRGAMTISPTHRIRLYVSNKSKEKEKPVPKLDKERITKLDRVKEELFKALKAKDLPKSKEFLSDLIRKRVTDEQIYALIESINFDKQTDLFYSGVQMGFNGKTFALLQYKYSNDKSSPPVKMIKLIFDDKNKVVGIQPIQRKKLN